METIARPHGIVDRPGAHDLVVSHGEIRFVYGQPDAGVDAAVEAAKRAHAHEFILNLEDKGL
jgi:hypothetical protein